MKFFISFLLFCFFSVSAQCAQEKVTIVRDIENSRAVNEIINKIISSIERYVPLDLIFYTEKEKFDISTNTVVGIGEKSISIVNSKDSDLNKILIGNMNSYENAISFAFVPSPKEVVDIIKRTFPEKRQVYLVSNRNHQWIDRQYSEYMYQNGIKLNIYYASSLRSAVENYKNVLNNIDPKTGLLLINENSSVDDEVILPYILNKSWDDDVVVVSTKASHAKYGILMSLVPNIESIGQKIKKCLQEKCSMIDNIEGFDIAEPLVNKRMYKHLELDFNNEVIFLE